MALPIKHPDPSDPAVGVSSIIALGDDNVLYPIVNGNDVFMNYIMGKRALHESGKLHRASHLFIETFYGGFLLQKKAPGTENAGKWSSSVSGHVQGAEGYITAVIREAKEELGLELNMKEVERIAKIPACEDTGREFAVLFTYLMNPEIERLYIDTHEVEQVIIRPLEVVIEDVCKNPEDYSPAFKLLFNIFLDRRRS